MRTIAPLALMLSACVSQNSYVVTRADLDQFRSRTAPEQSTALLVGERSGVRSTDPHRHVRIKGATIVSVDGDEASGTVRIHTRAPNRVVTAAIVLTCIGSAISLVGTALFLAQPGNRIPGGIVALSAEPIMGLGTILWPWGLNHPPQEER